MLIGKNADSFTNVKLTQLFGFPVHKLLHTGSIYIIDVVWAHAHRATRADGVGVYALNAVVPVMFTELQTTIPHGDRHNI